MGCHGRILKIRTPPTRNLMKAVVFSVATIRPGAPALLKKSQEAVSRCGVVVTLLVGIIFSTGFLHSQHHVVTRSSYRSFWYGCISQTWVDDDDDDDGDDDDDDDDDGHG